jgi:uncharacterized HhH-GPD family protein
MAARVQALCQAIVEEYSGRPAAVWTKAPDGADLLKRLMSLPGFGAMKAKIFLALLGKQVGLEIPGWQEACAPYGTAGSFLSVADVVDEASLAKVREKKAKAKAKAAAK